MSGDTAKQGRFDDSGKYFYTTQEDDESSRFPAPAFLPENRDQKPGNRLDGLFATAPRGT